MNKIFFEKQLYDAYSIIIDILNLSKKEIIIIDNYAGKELLDIVKNIDKKIIIVSKNINESFHDRFIIIDRKVLYTCGSSLKDIGNKCFAISRFNDNDYLNRLIEVIFSENKKTIK